MMARMVTVVMMVKVPVDDDSDTDSDVHDSIDDINIDGNTVGHLV